MCRKLLEIKDLTTIFHTDSGLVKAVNNVSLEIGMGEILGVVGESGCGKSVTSLSVMGLIPEPPGRIASGEILFQGCDLRKATEKELRQVRGRDIAMIFQEPMTSLNPVFTIGSQILEVIRLHSDLSRQDARKRVIESLESVSIPDPERRYSEYPHQLSGGMRQRVMIAMALACNPKLLIADEPTTALDVTIQAQILDLLLDLRKRLGLAILFITHDLGVVAEITDRVAVMYAGKIVETGSTSEIFKSPLHPYTRGLLRSVPRVSDNMDLKTESNRLETIEGSVPSLADLPPGCAFQPRCSEQTDPCGKPGIKLVEPIKNHRVRCILHSDRSGV